MKIPLLASIACTLLIASPVFAANKIQVHGHRGARAKFPENTLPAFEYAIKSGVDALELDLAVTSDGVLVVSHDPHINAAICRKLGGEKIEEPAPLIHSLTLAQVKGYDCGAVQNPRFTEQKPVPGTPIPTLEEVIGHVKKSNDSNAKRVLLNIETKIRPDHPEETVTPAEFSKLVVTLLKKAGMLNRAVLQSFDPRTLVEARKLESGLATALLVEDPKLDMLHAAQAIHANIVSPEWILLTPELVGRLHEAGFKVLPWTVNEPKDWDKVLAMKVDGIISDDPARLIEYLRSH